MTLFKKNSGKELKRLLRGKNVHISMDWDADGISAGALIYHFLADICTITYSATRYQKKMPKSDFYIFVDCKPTKKISVNKTIIIDHHIYKRKAIFKIHQRAQSSTLLIFDHLFADTTDPYILFLTLIGYFGDDGKKENIPAKLLTRAKKYIPELLQLEKGISGDRFVIEKYTATLNVGKRMHWSGDLPFELLRTITEYKELTNKTHPIAKELEILRRTLKHIPNIEVILQDTGTLLFGEITHPANIQGWLCKKYLDTKPVLIINTHDKNIHGSLRVPDDDSSSAIKIVKKIARAIPGTDAGGHEKAAGFKTSSKNYAKFINTISE